MALGMENLKELLAKECNYRFSMDTPVMEKFIASMTEIRLRSGELLTLCGQMDTNIYVVRSGIMRLTYFDDLKEKTFAFGTPGTLLAQLPCYYMHRPSFFQSEACTNAVVMKVSKDRFDSLLAESAELTQWFLDRALDQLCGLEMRLDRFNGMAGERYAAMVKVMPEVVGSVSSKIIASYLGITPAYLSQIKKKYAIRVEKNEGEVGPFASHSVKSTK